MARGDWPAVAAIYAEGIATGQATFETDVQGWEEWDSSHPAQRVVAEQDGCVLGFAALAPSPARPCYRGVAEDSVYVAAAARGRGIGRALLEALVAVAEATGIWTIEAGIFPENRASLSLHRGCGFRIVGRRERIGQLGGVWRDTLLLERRSTAP